MNRPIILTNQFNDDKLVVFSDDICYMMRKSHETMATNHFNILVSPYTEICIIKDSIVKTFSVNEDVEEILELMYK